MLAPVDLGVEHLAKQTLERAGQLALQLGSLRCLGDSRLPLGLVALLAGSVRVGAVGRAGREVLVEAAARTLPAAALRLLLVDLEVGVGERVLVRDELGVVLPALGHGADAGLDERVVDDEVHGDVHLVAVVLQVLTIGVTDLAALGHGVAEVAVVEDAVEDLVSDDEDALVEVHLEEPLGVDQQRAAIGGGSRDGVGEQRDVLGAGRVEHRIHDVGERGALPHERDARVLPQLILLGCKGECVDLAKAGHRFRHGGYLVK